MVNLLDSSLNLGIINVSAPALDRFLPALSSVANVSLKVFRDNLRVTESSPVNSSGKTYQNNIEFRLELE